MINSFSIFLDAEKYSGLRFGETGIVQEIDDLCAMDIIDGYTFW